MEFILQQEGNLGIILLLASLLVGVLYLLLPIFIWRIWFWSRQNSKHLKELNSKLELLIREIAPDALPQLAVPAAEESAEETGIMDDSAESIALAATGAGIDDDLFSEEFEGDLGDEGDMDFSMSDDFDDISDEIADSEVADFTEGDREDFPDEMAEENEDELVMDFDEGEEKQSIDEEPEEFSTATDDGQLETPEEDREAGGDDFSGAEEESETEIPMADDEATEFTVEHFESNEEKSFEFEDVDDSFGERSDTFTEEDFKTEPASTSAESDESLWDESSTDDIWGDEASPRDDGGSIPADSAAAEPTFASSDSGDIGAAFDETEKSEEEGVGDVASSFLSDLESKLNLEALSAKPAAAPPPPEPAPEPKEKPAESQTTLFARCEGCGHKLAYKQALSGKRVRCPACRTAFTLP